MNIGVIAVVTCSGLSFATIKSSISRITYQIDSVENHGMSYKDQVLLVKILLRIRKKRSIKANKIREMQKPLHPKHIPTTRVREVEGKV